MASAGAGHALRVLAFLAILAVSQGTHFRFGTIRWTIDQASIKYGSITLDINQAHSFTVNFDMKLAFRRDYSWGAFFNEQWRINDGLRTWINAPQQTNCANAGIQCFPESPGIKSIYESSYQIKFPNGQGTNGIGLVPDGSPKVCAHPLHKGSFGDPFWDPAAGVDCNTFGGYMASSPGNSELRCSADEYLPAYHRTFAPVDPANPKPNSANETAECTPWHEVVGFYFGDDSFSFDDGDSDGDGPVLNIEEVDFEGSLLGNVIVGSTETFSHTYEVPTPHLNTNGYSESPLWVAYFAGGNRLSTLVNNANGRFRLEVGVKFDFVNRKLIANRSPQAYMVPVLAVPYVATTGDRLGAHFQIAAFDNDYYVPELRDEVRYFLGNSKEHGGIQANMVYTRPTPSALNPNPNYQATPTWFQDYYYYMICTHRVAEGTTAGVKCKDVKFLGPHADPNYSQDSTKYKAGVDFYDSWNNLKNLPQAPFNMDIDPKTGIVVWETGAGPGQGARIGNFGERVVDFNSGGGLEPGFYNMVVMIEERHNGDAAMGYPDDIDALGNDLNDGVRGEVPVSSTGFAAANCRDDYDQVAGRKPVYDWEKAIVGGTGLLPANYNSNSPGIDICRASPASPPPPSAGPTYGAVKVPLDFLLYLYPTMHYCSQGCNMPPPKGGNGCGPWNHLCQEEEVINDPNSVMQTFETDIGWYGETGSRADGLSDLTVDNVREVTGACKICGGGGGYLNQVVDNLATLVTVDYKPVNGSIYCEVPDLDPLDQGALTSTGLNVAYATWNASSNLVGSLTFDALQYNGEPVDASSFNSIDSGSTASFRLRKLYDHSASSNFPTESYPYVPPASSVRGQFPPSRTSTTQIGSVCSQGWLSMSDFLQPGTVQGDFVFQGCLGTSAGFTDRFGAQLINTNDKDNPFGGAKGTSILPVEGANCYINQPPRFVTFCSCDNVTETIPFYGNTPAMGCQHVMQVKNSANPYLAKPVSTHLATCCPDSQKLTTGFSTNSGDLAKYPGMFVPANVRGLRGSEVNFFLTARDDDQCTELVVGHLGLPDPSMSLGAYNRLDARTVSRKFSWTPRDATGNFNDVPTKDDRDTQSLVCFYASDRYDITALPFHCVQITLENPTTIVWCDQDKDTALFDVINRRELVGEENFVYKAYAGEEFKLPLCVMKRESTTTAMNQNLNIWKIQWEDVGGSPGHPSDPLNEIFNYPYDEINFPASGKLMYDDARCEVAYDRTNDETYQHLPLGGANWYPSQDTDLSFQPSSDTTFGSCRDPLYMYYSFTPQDYEECVYTVCFQGYDELTAPEGVPVDPTLNSVETTDVRCFKIEVYNNVLTFDGASGAIDVEVSQMLLPQEGFTMTVWAYPECQTSPTNMTVAYFGSVRDFSAEPSSPGRRDTGNEVRNALRFMDMGNGLGRFFYYDIYVGAKMTEQTFCCGKWHHVGVSIMANDTAYLFVDGVDPVDQLEGSRDTIKFEVVDFETSSRPDHLQDTDTQLSVEGIPVLSSGYLALGYYPGQALVGSIDEVRVWSRYMTKSEAKELLYTRDFDYAADSTLKGHYTMGDGRIATEGENDYDQGYLPSAASNPGGFAAAQAYTSMTVVHTWSFNSNDALANYADDRKQSLMKWPGLASEPLIEHKGVPVQVPCVLGMQHAVGPVDGQCVTDVYVWNAADSINPKCSFGGVEMPGTWVSDDVIRCETPGHFTPRFVVVKASNDGTRFSDPMPVDKTVNHLFLESSLYVDGNGGGAEADSVCMDIPKRAVSFGGWTCAKCGPATPDAPPPPSPPPSPPPPSPPPPPPVSPDPGGR